MNEILPWLNVLVVPGVIYIIRLERRIIKLEVMIAMKFGIAIEP